MKIAMTQKKARWGGQPRHILDLAIGLRERGHEIVLFSQEGEFCERARSHGFDVTQIDMKNSSRRIPAMLKLASALRRNRMDIVHCHDSYDHQLATAAARLAGVPAIVRTKHNLNPLRNAGSRWMLGKLTTRIIGVSHAVTRMLSGCGIDPGMISTVHHFVTVPRIRPETEKEDLKRQLSIPKDAPVIGNVGRQHRSKGIGDLIRALPEISRELPDVRLLLVGSWYGRWPPLARELEVEERCIFTGYLPNVGDYLSVLDAFVLPSYQEPFGLALLEAMAAGCAVIATDAGGVPEIVRHGVDGLLVEPRRPDLLATAALRLLRDEELRVGLQAMARTVASRFNRDRTLTETARVYELALQRSKRGSRRRAVALQSSPPGP
jgi:glycosyltransferase involved in cell wall biosynthesis